MNEDDVNVPLPTVGQFVSLQQALKGVTDGQLADAADTTESVVRLIKSGGLKMPVTMIKQMAGALEISPRQLLRVLLNEYMPELHALMEDLRMPTDLTENERELLIRYRVLAQGRDAKPVVLNGITIVFPKSM